MKDKIDWDSQWAKHAPGYREGYLHVNLSEYSANTDTKELKLVPGPGFGDLSHPTTRLVLQLMPPIVHNRHVLDVGCGSGILSFAAAAMGAMSVAGIDIDQDALTHARSNSKLNGRSKMIEFTTPQEYSRKADHKMHRVLLMNMIRTEQYAAWHSLGEIHSSVTSIVSSGILVEEEKVYLSLLERWGFTPTRKQEESGWLAFIFIKKN